MFSYALLESGCYYLIQEKEDSPLIMINILTVSDYCMYVHKYGEAEVLEWKKKDESIHDIIELLSDSVVAEWREAYYNATDTSYYEEEDE